MYVAKGEGGERACMLRERSVAEGKGGERACMSREECHSGVCQGSGERGMTPSPSTTYGRKRICTEREHARRLCLCGVAAFDKSSA